MGTRIVARRYDLSEDMKSYIEGKSGKLNRYYPDGIMDVEVALTQEKLQATVAIKVSAAKFDLKSSESTEDMRSAFDLALKKVEHQLKKTKDRLWGNKKHRKQQKAIKTSLAEDVSETSAPVIKKVEIRNFKLVYHSINY